MYACDEQIVKVMSLKTDAIVRYTRQYTQQDPFPATWTQKTTFDISNLSYDTSV